MLLRPPPSASVQVPLSLLPFFQFALQESEELLNAVQYSASHYVYGVFMGMGYYVTYAQENKCRLQIRNYHPKNCLSPNLV